MSSGPRRFLQNIQENMAPKILATSIIKFLFVCHYFVFSNYYSRNALVPFLYAQWNISRTWFVLLLLIDVTLLSNELLTALTNWKTIRSSLQQFLGIVAFDLPISRLHVLRQVHSTLHVHQKIVTCTVYTRLLAASADKPQQKF